VTEEKDRRNKFWRKAIRKRLWGSLWHIRDYAEGKRLEGFGGEKKEKKKENPRGKRGGIKKERDGGMFKYGTEMGERGTGGQTRTKLKGYGKRGFKKAIACRGHSPKGGYNPVRGLQRDKGGQVSSSSY